MRQYEADTWYDANGRIVFIVWKGEDELEEQLYNRVLAVIGSPGD